MLVPLMIPRPQHFDLLPGEKRFALGIARDPVRQTVLKAVQFYRQARQRRSSSRDSRFRVDAADEI